MIISQLHGQLNHSWTAAAHISFAMAEDLHFRLST